MQNSVDLYRSVKPNELLTKFKFNSSSDTVTLDQLFENVPPKLLGSFKLDKNKKEVDLLIGGAVWEKSIPRGFRQEICEVRRLNDSGISCFNEEAHISNVQPLPPVGDTPLETGRWYYLEAAEIEGNDTLREYLNNEPDSRNFQYNEYNSAVFLYYKLPAGVSLAVGYETHFDNNPLGHWTIRRSDFDQFDACFCQIGGGFNYGMIPDLVSMGWTFCGLKLVAAAEPTDYNDSYDKDTWTLAAIIHAYFSCLSSEELVNDATMILTDLSTGKYSRKSCSSPIIAKVLLRVLDDLVMCCSELELATVSRFKLGLNEAVMNVFEPMLSISKDVNEKEIISSGKFWCSMFHRLQFIVAEFDRLPQEPLTLEADRFSTFYRKLNIGCQECPSNNILNALTYKYTLYYLQDVAGETLDFMMKMQDTTVVKAPTDVGSAGQDSGALNDSFASVNTTFIRRVTSHGRDPRTKWVCAVCQDGCKIGDVWYTLCNCGHKFHVQCIGPWIFKENAVNGCPLCRTSVAASLISDK